MLHDALCELETNRGHGCNCGSRACPLCDGCRNARHASHVAEFTTTLANTKTVVACTCPTCEEAA